MKIDPELNFHLVGEFSRSNWKTLSKILARSFRRDDRVILDGDGIFVTKSPDQKGMYVVSTTFGAGGELVVTEREFMSLVRDICNGRIKR